MKRYQKKVKIFLMSLALTGMLAGEASAGWIQTQEGRWWYATDDTGTSWYASGPGGVGWHWIDGNQDGIFECYAFDPDGWMYADTVTPDGYSVNADGAWVVDGIVQIRRGGTGTGSGDTRAGRPSGGGSGGSGGGHGSGGQGNGSHSDSDSSSDSHKPPAGSEEPSEPGEDTGEPVPGEQNPGDSLLSYTVRLTELETGRLLKEITGEGQSEAMIQLGYELNGYTLAPGQELSPVLKEDGEVFTVYYTRNQTSTATGSDAEELYRYTVRYVDEDSGDILGTRTGTGEKGETIPVEFPEIDGYEVCGGQPEEFILTRDRMIQNIYYQAAEEATPSDARRVKWEIRFVDEDHAKTLWPAQTGSIRDGGELTVQFPETIRKDGVIWESLEEPPLVRTIDGPGKYLEYVEYENRGDIPQEPDPEEEQREALAAYLEQARECDSQITGEEPDTIPDSRFLVSDQAENDSRVLSIASQAEDEETHPFYVIGQDFVPNGKAVAEWFGAGTEYSNLLEDVIQLKGVTYYVARMSIRRELSGSGRHQWEAASVDPATCLGKGRTIYRCSITGEEREVILPPLGHTDADQDSVCDRCGTRAFPQTEGSQIKTELAGTELSFTCIDGDYRDTGGMLYLADQVIPLEFFGGYGSPVYGESRVRKYFRDSFQNDCSIRGLMGIELPGVLGVDYAVSLSKEEYESCRGRIPASEPFFLRDNEGDKLWGVGPDGAPGLTGADEAGYGIRPAILLKKPDAGTMERMHWSLGDVQAREIDGETYMFRCIDENYADGTENHRQAALFFCETVIPADLGSRYEVEEQEDGSHRPVFVPGPIVNFGETNDYKYSKIHRWLEETAKSYGTEPVRVGVDYAYMGSTPEGMYSEFSDSRLKPSYIGDQKLTARVFILSVDEAVKYKDHLWRFEGEETDNPETQISAFSKGYWMRTPMGDLSSFDTDCVYEVDLERGNIRPVPIRPQKDGEGDGSGQTGTTGVRPAFAMPQDR